MKAMKTMKIHFFLLSSSSLSLHSFVVFIAFTSFFRRLHRFHFILSSSSSHSLLIFLSSLFWKKRQGKPSKRQGLFFPSEPLKSLENTGKTLKKARSSLRKKKKQGIPKSKERKIRVCALLYRTSKDAP